MTPRSADDAFREDESATRKHTLLREDEPTVERPISDAVAVAARDEDFRTGRVTFEEILARVASGPAQLPAAPTSPPPPPEDDPYSTDALDADWTLDE